MGARCDGSIAAPFKRIAIKRKTDRTRTRTFENRLRAEQTRGLRGSFFLLFIVKVFGMIHISTTSGRIEQWK